MKVWNVYIYIFFFLIRWYTFLLRFSREEQCHAAISRKRRKEIKKKIRWRKYGKTGNNKVTIATRRTRAGINYKYQANNRGDESLRFVAPANQSLGGLIPHCPPRPALPILLASAKQCLTAANFCNVHLGKTPFALKWRQPSGPACISCGHLLSSPSYNSSLRVPTLSPLFNLYRIRQRSRIVIEQTRPQPTHLRVNYLLLCPMSLLTAFLSLSRYETRDVHRKRKKQPIKVDRNIRARKAYREILFFSLFFFWMTETRAIWPTRAPIYSFLLLYLSSYQPVSPLRSVYSFEAVTCSARPLRDAFFLVRRRPTLFALSPRCFYGMYKEIFVVDSLLLLLTPRTMSIEKSELEEKEICLVSQSAGNIWIPLVCTHTFTIFSNKRRISQSFSRHFVSKHFV